MTTYQRAEFPAPDLAGADPCGACDGTGLTGETTTMRTSVGIVIVCDTFCPSCGGCGRAEHQGCARLAHGIRPGTLEGADPHSWGGALQHDDLGDEADEADEDADEGEPECPSCGGRRWWPAEAYSSGEDPVTMVMRVPCGCAESVMVEVRSA